MVMAIDPGRCKSGIVVMNNNFDILFQKVIESLTLESVISTGIPELSLP